MSELTSEDYASIERAAQELRDRGLRNEFSLNELFEEWAALVAQVERGYSWTVYEYTNEMACRDLISAIWPMLTDRVRDARAEELGSLDARFKAATENDGGLAIGKFYRIEDKDGWWWRRRPIEAAGKFAADLTAD